MWCRNLGAQLQAPAAHPAPGAGGPAHPPGRGRQQEAGRGRAGSVLAAAAPAAAVARCAS